jgi:DnaJ-class molecular chaperone
MQLDSQCVKCGGKGWYHTFDAYGKRTSGPDGVTCPECCGEGYPLTDAGRELLRFLQRHPPALTRT